MLDRERKELDSELKKGRNEIRTERLDMSIGEIESIYKKNELEISPDFQRLFRWNEYQKTKLVESILLGIPIPPIFVVQSEDGKWELIDGLQRLSTLFSFMGSLNNSEKNNWKLIEGDILKKIEGLSFDELSKRAQIDIQRYICRVEILSSDSDYNIRYELFNRLNTGGTKLSAQEIRNVIYRGTSDKFNKFLRTMGENKDFLNLIDISNKKREALFADELVLRFCALCFCKKITTILNQHLNNFMKKVVEDTKIDDSKIIEFSYKFSELINLLTKLNDNEIFRPVSKRGGFSTTLYDGIMVGLSNNIDLYKNNLELLSKKILEVKKEFDEKDVFGSQAHNPEKVKKRIKLANKIFSKS